VIAALALLSACARSVPPPPAGQAASPSSEEAAVLAAMDRYVTAISAKDVQTMAAMQTPEGMTYRARAAEGGAWDVVAHPSSYWADPSRLDVHTHRERYWSPTVLVRGGIAVVWAPYEFWIDGKTSHCGVDLFDFVKVDGAWRVANSMWSVEPDACAGLRPADASIIRPAS
jgi:hypothetical protein